MLHKQQFIVRSLYLTCGAVLEPGVQVTGHRVTDFGLVGSGQKSNVQTVPSLLCS